MCLRGTGSVTDDSAGGVDGSGLATGEVGRAQCHSIRGAVRAVEPGDWAGPSIITAHVASATQGSGEASFVRGKQAKARVSDGVVLPESRRDPGGSHRS